MPSPWTLASGALLISALVGHEVAAMYAQDEDTESDHGSLGSPVVMGSRVPSMSSLPSSPLFPGKTSPLSRPADAVTLGVSLLGRQGGACDPIMEGHTQRSGSLGLQRDGYVPPECGVQRRTTLP